MADQNALFCYRTDGTCYAILSTSEWVALRTAGRLDVELARRRASGVVLAAVKPEPFLVAPHFKPRGDSTIISAPPPAVEPRQIFAFQTGRLYTVNGQRIAYTRLASGRVAMYDVDRMVDYVLILPGDLTHARVLAAYDDTRGPSHAGYNREDWDEAREVQPVLIQAALALPPPRAR